MSQFFTCKIRINSSDRSVTIENDNNYPDDHLGILTLINKIKSNLDGMDRSISLNNIKTLMNNIYQSTFALDENVQDEVTETYNSIIQKLDDDSLGIDEALDEIKSTYLDVLTSDVWKTTSKMPSKNIVESIEVPKKETKTDSILSKQGLVNAKKPKGRGVKVTNLKNIPGSKIEFEKTNVETAVSSGKTNFLPVHQMEEVAGLKESLLELFVSASSDYNVLNFVIVGLSKTIMRLTLPYAAMPEEKKIKRAMITLKGGIPENSFTTTKDAMNEVEEKLLEIFPGDSLPYIPESSIDSVAKKSSEFVITSILDDSTKISTFFGAKKEITNEEKEFYEKYIFAVNNSVQRLKSNSLGAGKRRSGIVNRFFEMYRQSGLSTFVGKAIESYLESNYHPNGTLSDSYSILDDSELLINSRRYDESDILVNFEGELTRQKITGSFTVNEFFLNSIFIDTFINLKETSNQTRSNFCKRYGISGNNNDSLWKAINVFTFTYLTSIVYCILYKENAFGVDMYEDEYENLNFIFSKNSLKFIGNLGISERIENLRPNVKFIFSHAFSGNILFYMYRELYSNINETAGILTFSKN